MHFQLLFTATLLAERSPNGLLLCHVEQFPASTKELVVDSHCLLGHLERPVRNAPPQQIGLWCTLRKIPLDGNWWRVVGVATKSARKKQPPIMTVAEAAKNSSTIKMVHMESGKSPANQKVFFIFLNLLKFNGKIKCVFLHQNIELHF